MRTLPLLAVVFDRGSAGSVEILASARKLCSVVFVCDEDLPGSAGSAARLAEVARVLDVTGLSPAERRSALRALRPDGITTFSEYRLAATAELAEACGLTFHPPHVAAVLVDKERQRTRLREAGVQSTRCVAVRTAAQVPAALAEVGLPAVVKPRSGAGSVDTCRVDSAEQAVAVAQEFLAGGGAEFVLEEYLEGDPDAAGPGFGDYVSVESVSSGGAVRHVCVTGKLPLAEPFRETGMFQPAALPGPLAEQVLGLTGAALRALGVTDGVTHVEIKLTPDGPRLIEVNGRMGGYVGALLRRSTRFDLLRAALRAALGLPLEIPELHFPAVEFVYFLTPPADAGATLAGIRGLDEVAAMEEVWQVKADPGAGRSLHWRAGTEGHLGTVHGTAADHDRLRAAVGAIGAAIRLEYA
ncbi:ATP-grasp domain-containing protein [Streptomyces sp. 3211.6]|uniref:ATP-grasp domain-containing protein n=1 Tax=Streptomyces TaxID=1883 RepID=UPI0009A4BAF6|nr:MULTISPECIES: ATP-grasp domain-containing protein [Streptomyces]RKT08370.1 ATP-grasp domain-containing protein [Streptomyces sp. 3211.6]